MADYEHLWISDSEISYGKKSGGSRLTIPRDDRRDHSRILDRSFSEAWEAMESHPSSFDNPDTVVLVMKFNGVRRKKNITDRRDAELSSLGMEVKAVIDGEYILIGMRKDDMTSLRSKLRSYGDETASVDILDEIEGFSPNTGLRKCSDDVISDSETGSIDTILLLVPNMTDADYETAFPNIERRVRELGGTVRHESISSVGMPYMSVTIPSEGAVQSICDDQAIYRVYKDEKASLDDFFLSEPWLNDLKPDFVRSIHLKPCLDIQKELDETLKRYGKEASIIAMPYGGSTLPCINI